MRHPKQQSHQSIERARQLRQASTQGENLLWQIIRNRSLSAKFRRQHPLGPYVIDFYCVGLKFAIELDGTVHDDDLVRAYDRQRETWLRGRGISILRIRTEQVVANPKIVRAQIRQELDDLRRCAERRRN